MAMKNDNSNSLETFSVNKSLEIRLVGIIILTFKKKIVLFFIWNKSSKFLFFALSILMFWILELEQEIMGIGTSLNWKT